MWEMSVTSVSSKLGQIFSKRRLSIEQNFSQNWFFRYRFHLPKNCKIYKYYYKQNWCSCKDHRQQLSFIPYFFKHIKTKSTYNISEPIF